MINALSIDVEDYFQVAAFNSNINHDEWSRIDSRVERNTLKCLELLELKNVKATFFVLGWIVERFPALVKEIANAGHEVASHGYSHKLVYQQTRDEFFQETEYSKKLLEDVIQQPIKGYRAASYSITRDSLWALDTIEAMGFEYDSSIYPVRHDLYGLQGGPHEPYRIDLGTGRELVEFPITTVNLLGYQLPVGGGGYFRIYPLAITKRLLRMRASQTKAPFVFYFHPWELDPEQPRVGGASWRSRFRHYYNLDKVEARLLELMDLFEFGTLESALSGLSHLPTHRYADNT